MSRSKKAPSEEPGWADLYKILTQIVAKLNDPAALFAMAMFILAGIFSGLSKKFDLGLEPLLLFGVSTALSISFMALRIFERWTKFRETVALADVKVASEIAKNQGRLRSRGAKPPVDNSA